METPSSDSPLRFVSMSEDEKMKRLLLPLLTCSLLAACGTGGTPDTGGVGGGGGTGGATYTVSGDVLLPGTGAQSLSVARSSQPDWNLPHVAGEVLIVGGGTLSTLQLPGMLRRLSVQDTGAAGIQRVQTPAGETDAAFAARLSQQLQAQGQQLAPQGLNAPTVQPNYLYKALSVPNDPGYPTNAGVSVGGALYDQDYLNRINALSGWNAAQAAGDTALVGALTAVLDTGVDFSHPDLQGRLLPGYDFCATADAGGKCLTEDADPSEATNGNGHGTGSAGLIGAIGDNGKGLVGLTWSGRNILPVKVFDDSGNASTVTLAKGVDYSVKQGARVINMSLGLPGTNTDLAVARSIAAAANAGVVLIAAAGNTPDAGIYYPASDPNVMAIGAVAGTDPKASTFNDLACYSARPNGADKQAGKQLDLVAPGGNAGTGTASCFQTSPYDTLVLAPGGYTLSAGTSEAAPQVSGAASLILAVRPDLRGSQVRSVLKSSARAVSGGNLLDVGAAVKAALALPSNTARSYTLSVSAGALSKSFSGTLAPGADSVPYTLSGVPAGQTTLSASLNVGGTVSSGSVSVNVQSDLSGQNIQTR
jgi:subtilisin family serine protease